MRKTIRTVSLLILLPLFVLLQTMLVPHVHFDESGEVHAHSHLLADDFSESAGHHENLEADAGEAADNLTNNRHKHTHDELHANEPMPWLLFSSKIQISGTSFFSGFVAALPPEIIHLAPAFKSFSSTAYLDHIFRMGASIALGEHIKRMQTVRIIS